MAPHTTPRAVAAAVLFSFVAISAAAAPAHSKVDRALRHQVDDGQDRTQRVIITVNPGCRGAVVDELAKSPCVKALSADAPVQASGAAANDNSASARRSMTVVDQSPAAPSTL